MNLPIPTTLWGWLATILIVILLFVAYYGCFFADLQSFYAGNLFHRSSSLVSEEPLKVDIDVPVHVAPSGQRWVYVKIQNKYTFPLRDVSVWLDVQPSDGEVDRQNLPFLFGALVAKPDVLTFEQIPPNGTVHGRLPLFIASSLPASLTVTVWVSPTLPPTERKALSNTMLLSAPGSVSVFGKATVNPMGFLAHSFIEQILLPPWSNGFIVLLVFVVCALVEGRVSKTEAGDSQKWWQEWWNVFYPSFMLVSFLTGTAFILPYLLWMLSLRELSSWIAVPVFWWILMGWWVLESLNLGSGALLEKWRSRMTNLPFARRGKIGSFIPRIIPLVPLAVGLVLLVVGWILRSHLPELLRPLVLILTGAMAVVLATWIKMRSTLVIPKPSGGRKWRKRRGTGGSRQPREYFRRSTPPRRKSG